MGRTLGLSPGSTLVLANTKQVSGMYAKLAAVAAALESIVKSDRMGNSVVSMSWAVENTNTNNIGESTSAVIRLLCKINFSPTHIPSDKLCWGCLPLSSKISADGQ